MPGPPPLRRRSPPGTWSGRGGEDAVKPACPHARVREGVVAPIARYDPNAIRDPAPGCFFAAPWPPQTARILSPFLFPLSFLTKLGGHGGAAIRPTLANQRPPVLAAAWIGCDRGSGRPRKEAAAPVTPSHTPSGGGVGGKVGRWGGCAPAASPAGGLWGTKPHPPPCAHIYSAPRHRGGVPRGTTGGGLQESGGGALQPTPRPPPTAADDAASAPVHGRPACLAV